MNSKPFLDVRRTTVARLALNCLCGAGLNVTTALVSVFLTPIILRQMGDQRYGMWAVLGSVYAYSMVLQLGLYSSINRHIPMYLARHEESRIREVASTTMAFFLAAGVVILVVTFGCGQRILGLFVIPGHMLSSARLALYTVGIVAAVCIALNSFGAVLSGYQRYELLTFGRLLGLGLRVVLVLTLLNRGEPLVTMALIFGITECLVGGVNLVLGWRLMPARPLQLRAVRWQVLREMFGYGVNTFIYAVGAVVVAKTGEVIIAAYLPPEHITYYTLALMPPMMLCGLVESLVGAIKPAVADLDTRNELGRIRELTLLSQKYVLLLVVPGMAFFLIMGNDFYFVWLHREMQEVMPLLYILAAGLLVHTVQFPVFLVLAGRGAHRVFGLLTVAMGVGAVILELLFGRIFGWGSIGVAIGSTVAMVVVSGMVLPVHAARRLGIPLADFWRRSWLPAAYGAGPAILLLLLWKAWLQPRTLLGLALLGVAVAVVVLWAGWFLALDEAERDRFSGMARTWVGKVAPATVFETMARLWRI